MVPLKLNWIYCENAAELQNKLQGVKGQLGIYVWIMKHSTPSRVFYVGEGNIWSRTLSHFEESISGRWMIFCWAFRNGDYMDFLREKVSGKDIKIELNKSEVEMGKGGSRICGSLFVPDKIKDRIDYISNHFSYAFAVSEEINHKHNDTRQAVEALLIKKLREYYTKECKLGNLKIITGHWTISSVV